MMRLGLNEMFMNRNKPIYIFVNNVNKNVLADKYIFL